MRYTEEQIIAQFQNIKEIDKLYDNKIIKRKGKGEKYFSEIIAAEILKNITLFDNIQKVSRHSNGKSYRTESHHKGIIFSRETNRREEIFAKELHLRSVFKINAEIFQVLDFQIPLKDERSDKLGKIDLLAFNDNTSTLYLIELKYGKSNETLLRAILESYTYYKIIDADKLKSDFELKDEIKVKAGVMVICPECNAYRELEDIENRPALFELSKKLDMTFFKSADKENFYIYRP